MHQPSRRSARARFVLLAELLGIAALTLVFAHAALRAAARSDGLVEIGDEEVAIVLDLWTGEQRAVTTPGYEVVLPELQEIYALDRSPVEYLMSGPDRMSSNHVSRLVVRSRDGSTYWFERVSIQYGLDTARLDVVLQDSGPDDAFKDGLVDAFARAVLLQELGRFTAEEIVSPEAVQGATRAAKERLNAALAPHGVEVYEVALSKPFFDSRYEDTIERRKVAEEEIQALHLKAVALEDGKGDAIQEIARKLANELDKSRVKWQLELEALAEQATRLRAGRAEEIAQLDRYQAVELEKARAEWRQQLDAQRRATRALEEDAATARAARASAAGLELEAARAEWASARAELEHATSVRAELHAARLDALRGAKALEREALQGTIAQRLAEADAAALGAEHEAAQYQAERRLAGELQRAQQLARAATLAEEHRREHEAFVARAQALAANGAVSVRAALVAKLRSIAFEIAPFSEDASHFPTRAPEGAQRSAVVDAH